MSPDAPRRIDALAAAQAALRPQALAIRDADGREVTYGAYDALIEEAAGLLRAQGAGPGERVLIVAENCLAVPVLIFACSRIGAWAVPVNARMAPAEIARIRAHARPVATLFTSGVSAEAAAHAQEAGAAPLQTGFGALHMATGESAPEEGIADVAVVLYTTGTTGDPKGVMLTHGNLIFAGNASAGLRGMQADDLVYGALPLTHVFGLASMLMAATTMGAAVQLETRFSPERLLAALRGGASILPAVPQMHALVMKHTADLGMKELGPSRLRYVSSGAAPLDPAWKRKAEAFYGIAMQNGYGMTESTAGVCGTRNPMGTPDISVGPPLPGVELHIDAPDAEGVGEILVRGAHVMAGYYRDPEGTARVLSPEGWLRTGDLGFIDPEGKLHVVGRCKELIIRSGFNVYPPEVEAALNDHPGVVQSAVIGRRQSDGNEEVLAFAQCAPGTTEEALKAFVAGRLSNYKRPARILVVDQLPAAATGKILKHRLLDTFAAQLDAPDNRGD